MQLFAGFHVNRQRLAARAVPPGRKAAFTPFGTPFADPLSHRTLARRHETIMGDSLFGIHGMALELRSQRLGLLTSNIANAGTPGYKARDIDFGSALKAMAQGANAAQAIGNATQYRVPVMPALDGNTVEMATEQTAFAENAIGYEATLNMIQDRVQTISRALKGE
jgi:flagellar basal-body rod protein FlgB